MLMALAVVALMAVAPRTIKVVGENTVPVAVMVFDDTLRLTGYGV